MHGTPSLVAFGQSDVSVTALIPLPPDESSSDDFNEKRLQQIIDAAPEVLSIREFLPEARMAVSLGREIPVDLGGREGYIDNLLVTDTGHLVLVETKLWRNPLGLREVVAQIMHYGSGLMSLPLTKLEGAIRRGTSASKNRLLGSESISDRALAKIGSGGGAAAFEDRLDQLVRTGEMLFLIVGDGMHQSVERFAAWLGELKALPFKIGLIELRFFHTPSGERLVVPRTLLRTKEVARHVVLVNVTNETLSRVEAVLQGEQVRDGGATRSAAIDIRSQPPIDEGSLVAAAEAESKAGAAVLAELLRLLREADFDSRETSKWIQFGLKNPEGGPFLGMIGLSAGNMYAQQAVNLFDLVGSEAVARHRKALNQIAPFYTPEGVSNPIRGGTGWLQPKYEPLRGSEKRIVDELVRFRDLARSALESQMS